MSNTLTVERVFKEQRYLNILNLIFLYEKKDNGIKRSQLYEALRTKGNKEFKDNLSEFDRKMISDIKFFYDSGKITKQVYENGIALMKKGAIQREKEKGNISSKNTFKSVLGLRNALRQLKKLELINNVRSKYSYWVLTDYGLFLHFRYQIHSLVDNPIFFNTSEDLKIVNKMLLRYVLYKKMKERKKI